MGRKTYGDRSNKDNREVSLKKEIEKLRVENSRLKKEVNKLTEMLHTYNREPEETDAYIIKPKKESCKKCNSTDLKKVNALDKIYIICADCEHRTIIKAENNE